MDCNNKYVENQTNCWSHHCSLHLFMKQFIVFIAIEEEKNEMVQSILEGNSERYNYFTAYKVVV